MRLKIHEFVVGPSGEEVDLLPMVVQHASRLKNLPPTVDYEDLVAEAILQTMRSLRRYDPARGTKFSTFAWSCIRGAVLDLVRRELKFRSRHDMYDHAEAASSEHDTGTQVLFSEVMSVIEQKLPETMGRVLRWTFLDGETDAEIARRLGKSRRYVARVRESALMEIRRLIVGR